MFISDNLSTIHRFVCLFIAFTDFVFWKLILLKTGREALRKEHIGSLKQTSIIGGHTGPCSSITTLVSTIENFHLQTGPRAVAHPVHTQRKWHDEFIPRTVLGMVNTIEIYIEIYFIHIQIYSWKEEWLNL